MPSLSANGTQPLDVGLGRGGAAGLAQHLHQHVHQLDVEGLVTDLDLVPQADDGTLPGHEPVANHSHNLIFKNYLLQEMLHSSHLTG